jgi:hypothetical protein
VIAPTSMFSVFVAEAAQLPLVVTLNCTGLDPTVYVIELVFVALVIEAPVPVIDQL